MRDPQLRSLTPTRVLVTAAFLNLKGALFESLNQQTEPPFQLAQLSLQYHLGRRATDTRHSPYEPTCTQLSGWQLASSQILCTD